MEKKELRKKIEELDVKRKVKEIRGDTPDYDTDNRYHYVGEEDILELLEKAREEVLGEVLSKGRDLSVLHLAPHIPVSDVEEILSKLKSKQE